MTLHYQTLILGGIDSLLTMTKVQICIKTQYSYQYVGLLLSLLMFNCIITNPC